MSGDREEQLLLRVQDRELADKIKETLLQAPGGKQPGIEITFDGEQLWAN